MRTLKFRAWSNDHNRYCDFVTLDETGRWIGWIKSNGVYLTTIDIILEQYTGLKDKNGKEIYEGDILRLTREVARDKSTLYQVVWNEPTAEFDTKNLDEKGLDIGYLNKTAAEKDYLVIGNIHENPELIGGE